MSKRRYGSQKLYNHSFDISFIFFALCLFVYQILSSIFTFLPLLLGLFFCYMFILLKERQLHFESFGFGWYFSLFYVLFIDISHGFYLFSSWFAFIIFYYFCTDWLKNNFKINTITPILFVLCAYMLVFGVDSFFSYIADEKLKNLRMENFISIIIEALMAFFIFRGKL